MTAMMNDRRKNEEKLKSGKGRVGGGRAGGGRVGGGRVGGGRVGGGRDEHVSKKFGAGASCQLRYGILGVVSVIPVIP
jgi:hypothetical protein